MTAETLNSPSIDNHDSSPEARDSSRSVPGVFAEENIHHLRATEQDYINRASQGGNSTEELNTELNRVRATYLEALGISPDDENFVELQDALARFSPIAMTNEDFEYGKWTDDANQELSASARLQLFDAQRQHFPNSPVPDPLENSPDNPIDIDILHEEALVINGKFDEVSQARNDMATWTAKRQGRLGFLEGKSDRTKEIEENYREKTIELGRLQLSDVIGDENLEPTEKNRRVIEFLFAEQGKLRDQTTENLKGTKVGRFIDWMNRGNKVTRILKGASIGAAAAGAGALVGLASVSGVGIVAGSAIAAGRFARGFASADARNGRGMAELDDVAKSEVHTSLESHPDTGNEDIFHAVHSEFEDRLEEDTKNEQKKRRKSVVWGIGGVALGATAAFAVDGIMSRNSGGGSSPLFENPDEIEINPDVDNQDSLEPVGPEDPEIVPIVPDTTGPLPSDVGGYEFSAEAYTVNSGEGWYQTFEDMGIPEADRAELLGRIGPQLQQEGWAYQMADGQWGIAQPGQLPDNVLQLIQDSRR